VLEMTWVFSVPSNVPKGSVVRGSAYFAVGTSRYPPGTYRVTGPLWVSFGAKARNDGGAEGTIWIAVADADGTVLKVNSGSVGVGDTVDLRGSVYLESGKSYHFAFYAGHGTPPAQGRTITSWDDYYGFWVFDTREWGIPLWVWIFVPLGVAVIAYGLYTLSRR